MSFDYKHIDKFFKNLMDKKEAQEIQERIDVLRATTQASTIVPPADLHLTLLKQAIEDSKVVRATALANAKASLDYAFGGQVISPPTTSLDAVDKDVEAALEDVKPQIGYPGYVKPTKAPKEPEKEPGEDVINAIIDRNLYSNAISHSLNASYYKPNPDPSGAFQPSLKPKSNTNGYDFTVAIGNPHNNRLILNCIENSRKELIHFKDNIDVIREAIDKFNINYDPESITKTVLAGKGQDVLNISLQFDTLDFDGFEIRAHFSRYLVTVNAQGRVSDYVKCIKDTVYFYLKGELFLDENETKIEAMEITGLNYANPSRSIISEKFVYLH